MFNYTFHWHQAFRALPDMMWGALVTVEVAVLSMVLGIAFAVLLAVARMSSNRLAHGAATTWIEVARNTVTHAISATRLLADRARPAKKGARS